MGFGQVVIVTGGSRGIGLAVVEALLAHGAGVVCVSRSRPPVTHEHLLWLAEDLSAPDSAAVAKRVCDATLERFGRISGIVNNAGIIGPIARCDSVTGEQYIANYRVNFVAAVELVRACILDLRASRGRVINVSSGAALRGYVGWSAYCASKAALKVWTESFAIEERAVTAISFRPGIVDTEMQVDIRTSGAPAAHPSRPFPALF